MARKTERKYGSAATRAKAAAAVAGPGGGGGTMFQNIPPDTQFYKPEEGKATLRLLPYVVTDPKHPDGDMAPSGDIWYKRPFKRFRQIGTEKKSYISPKSIGKPCPIMEYYTAAKADPSIPDKEANRAKPQDMVMYNVQVMDPKTKEFSDPMFFFYSYHNFEKQLKKELLDPDNEEFLAFMDLEGGFDIRVRWEKETFEKNDFLVAGNFTFIERDEDLDEDILDKVVNLDECLIVKSYKELQNIFLELDDEPEPNTGKDEGEDQLPPRPPSRRQKTAEPEPEPEKPSRRGRAEKPEPEPEPEKPARRQRGAKPEPEPETESTDRCPHEFAFGVDFDTKRKCEKCDLFDECGDEFDANNLPKGEDKPAKSGTGDKKKTKPSDKVSDKNECPSGHIFGTDCDNKPECNDCVKWDDCMDRQEEMEKE